MNSSDLYALFRSDTTDTVAPYLWSEEEVWGYMADAQRMFVRLTGGVADVTSEVCEIPVVTGDPRAEMDKRILRVMSATRRSDGRPIDVLNATDLARRQTSDYGSLKPMLMDTSSGEVHSMVIGTQKGIVRWIKVPAADDFVDLHVYRLPLEVVSGADQEIADVDEEHHYHLLAWMKALAYRKQDAETLDAQQAQTNEAVFRNYCAEVKAEWERYKHKTRVVAYGGL